MKSPWIAFFFVLVVHASCMGAASQEAESQRIALWSGPAPIGDGEFEDTQAWLTVYRPSRGNRTAIVICPGGGYGGLVTGPEGEGIARWLNRHGITGAVLEYRLPAGRPYVPLLDAQRAIRMVRMNARQWDIEPAGIGIMGFSAGGHLASTAGTQFDRGNPNASQAIDRISCRPNFMILVYPVILMGEQAHRGSQKNLLGSEPSTDLVKQFSSERQVTNRTPPTFLAHARDDKPVPPRHSVAFYNALTDRKISCRYLELPSGGHGLNGYQGPMWDRWQNESLSWLVAQKLIPPLVNRE